MTDILIALFWIAVAITALAVIRFIWVRISFLNGLLKLRKIQGVSVEIISFPALLFPNVSKKPFASVKCRSTSYLVRIFNGISPFKSVHIASEKYAVVFSKSGGEVIRGVRGRTRRLRRINEPIRISRAVTKIIPPLDPSFIPEKKKLPEGYENFYFEEKNGEEKIIPTLIFCPAPAELTFVTPEKTSIKIAFTGDTVIGHRVFTPETFASYIDRDSRGFFD